MLCSRNNIYDPDPVYTLKSEKNPTAHCDRCVLMENSVCIVSNTFDLPVYIFIFIIWCHQDVHDCQLSIFSIVIQASTNALN